MEIRLSNLVLMRNVLDMIPSNAIDNYVQRERVNNLETYHVILGVHA